MPQRSQLPGLAKLVERQMRNWEIARAQRPDVPTTERPAVQDFIAVSRTVGSGGAEVASQLAERLGWPLFDREILQAMAGDDRIRHHLYEVMDERDLTWFEATARGLNLSEVSANDYFRRLTETVLSLARQSRAIFLGRGIDLILPRDRGLRVRVTAPRRQRLALLSQRLGLSPQETESELERITLEREDFIRRRFGVEANDPVRHDFVVNLERLTVHDAVELILRAARLRGFTGIDAGA
ncbi:MAG TPA: cytidylate kinase-like family protein [Phycisphaerae bacterium]|nr:cytidylate kinase-like family protein [Phycisphaerae bacterium]HNU46092.1 cytidylate kinase-like family protein [Phycisphaerae bacterium]